MNRTRLLLILPVALGGAVWLRGEPELHRRSPSEPAIDVGEARDDPTATGPIPAPCTAAGYLCADVDGHGEARVRRWRSDTGTLVVHVPRPSFESPAVSQQLQNAAEAGLRARNGQPFPIRVELRSSDGAHFSVAWSRSLGGRLLGAARTRWSPDLGLAVTSIDLVTRDPFDPDRVIDSDRIRLTAAHEMGHALGLPHSDSSRDVMYPENTAGALSARDYRTMEDLCARPDGSVLELRPGR